jgi:phospholipase D
MRGIRVVYLTMLAVAAIGPLAVAADHQPSPPHGPAMARVSVCFVPEQACGTAVTDAIDEATTFIRVQAYGFTAPAILRALAAARARGVDVQVILDKSSERERGNRVSGARFTAEANIPTWIDNSVAIAHNKVIIIDGRLVIGGSYNYTAAAERRNAENVTFIEAPVVADFYLVNWEARKAVSRPSQYESDEREDASHVVAAAKGR